MINIQILNNKVVRSVNDLNIRNLIKNILNIQINYLENILIKSNF